MFKYVIPRATLVAFLSALATAVQADQTTTVEQAPVEKDTSSEKPVTLEEVVVTGTHIRGAAPAGSSLKVYSRDDIEQSGAATMDQFARQMPENFSNVDTLTTPTSNASFAPSIGSGGGNQYGGSAFSLHGLGPDATLTLLNGHRLPASGKDGSVTDASLIPLSAVDHIETLSDGASAVYGADAVAGIVNIVTRKDFDGAQSTVRYGEATAGGASEITASQLFGRSWTDGNMFLNYEYDDQGGLDVSQRSYMASEGGPYLLLPENRRNSVFLSGSQNVGDTTLSLDAIYSRRDTRTQVTNHSLILDEGLIQGGYAQDSGVDLSVEHALFGDWRATATGNYSDTREGSDNVTNLNGFVNESVATLTPADSSILELNVLGNGSLVALPAGSIKAAVGGTYQREKFDSNQAMITTVGSLSSTATQGTPSTAQRSVTSGFVELYIPLVGESNALPGLRRLELSGAGRYDHYSDFGSTVNPKVGLQWEPVSGLDFRSTFGTSFTAPLLYQTSSVVQSRALPFPDSSSPAGVTDTLELFGGNPNLSPEKSRSFTAGFDVKPLSLPHSSLSLTYYHIDFGNRISTPPTAPAQSNIGNPILAAFLARNPPLSLVQSYFNSPNFAGDLVGLGPAGVQAIFNNQFANLAESRQSGLDLTAAYGVPFTAGHLNLSLSAERVLKNEFQELNSLPFFSLLNTFGEPPKWKGRGGVAWNEGPFTATAYVNYVNSYQNSLFTPSQSIASWTTGDLYFAYRAGATAPTYLLRNTTVALSILNVTNARPPHVEIPGADLLPGQAFVPYDPANSSPVGRFVSLSISKDW